MEQKTAKKRGLRVIAPIRLGITLAALAAALIFRFGQGNTAFMAAVCETVSRPWHAFFSRLCAHVPFSVAEVLIALLVLFVAGYVVYSAAALIRGPHRWRRVYLGLLTLAMTASLVWAGFGLLWTPYYSLPSFAQQAGMDDGPVAADDLIAVTRYFQQRVNALGEQVSRDADGLYTADRAALLDRAADIYDTALASRYPFLSGTALRPKTVYFSRIMSRLNFTGFFFPFTGEANVNTDAPVCLFAATAEHELSHQRGIAKEQECNFLAILACMDSGDADYAYSGALMAYIYLGNALSSADRDAWSQLYARLSEGVRTDLAFDSAYWAQFQQSAVQKTSEKVYEAFLQSNGQTLGLRSYGACVDLLVHYYADQLR